MNQVITIINQKIVTVKISKRSFYKPLICFLNHVIDVKVEERVEGKTDENGENEE